MDGGDGASLEAGEYMPGQLQTRPLGHLIDWVTHTKDDFHQSSRVQAQLQRKIEMGSDHSIPRKTCRVRCGTRVGTKAGQA